MAVPIPVFLDAVCMNSTGLSSKLQRNSLTESVSVVGVGTFPLNSIAEGLKEFFRTDGKAEGLFYPVHSFTLPEEVDRGDFAGCSHVLLCEDLSTWTDENTQRRRTKRLCKCMKAAFRVNADVCIGLLGDSGDFRNHVTTLCQDFPEFRWLLCSGRVINIHEKHDRWRLTTTCVDTLIAWLTVSGHTFEPQQLLDYKDMGQIIFRDLKEYIPEFMTFVRLGLLSLSGLLGILLTGLILTAITHEPSDQRSLRGGQLYLKRTLEKQRLGKCEWEPGDDAMALLALQLHQSDWCFYTVENQRSVDRMEIHLLATISRARHPTSRELTPIRLAQYINALLVAYQNPRDFHGHDLVSLLEAHVLRQGRHSRQGPFSRSLSIIALYNAKVIIDWGHVMGLLQLQKEDGRFGHSIDETCLSIMALACARGESGVQEALNKSITWLAEQRSSEGAYGHTYSTALALQAFNVTGSQLPDDDWHITMSWLLRQTTRDPAIKNIEIATQVLIALAGKSMLSVKNFTGLGSGDHDISYTPRLLPHIYVDGNEGVPENGMPEIEDTPEVTGNAPTDSEESPEADVDRNIEDEGSADEAENLDEETSDIAESAPVDSDDNDDEGDEDSNDDNDDADDESDDGSRTEAEDDATDVSDVEHTDEHAL